MVEEDAFTIQSPVVSTINPQSGKPLTEVTIIGKFLGTKKGKVFLQYETKGTTRNKTCKVTKWWMDPSTGDTEIRFLVPKGLTPWIFPYPLVISNYSGIVYEGAFWIE